MLSKEIQLEVNKGAMLPNGRVLYNSRRGFHGTAAYFVRIGGCDVGSAIGVTLKLECKNCIHLQASVKLLIMQKIC
jgi:hypothetical protein